jgi:hypothetical protein
LVSAGKSDYVDDEVDIEVEETFPSDSHESFETPAASSEVDGGETGAELPTGSGVSQMELAPDSAHSAVGVQRPILLNKDLDYLMQKYDSIVDEVESVNQRSTDVKISVEKVVKEGREVTHEDIMHKIDHEGGDRVAMRLANLISIMTRKFEFTVGQMESISLHSMRCRELINFSKERIQDSIEKSEGR